MGVEVSVVGLLSAAGIGPFVHLPVTLSAATTGSRSFTASGVLNGDLVSYAIYDANNHEYGTGVITVSGAVVTMSRVLGGSSTGALINPGVVQGQLQISDRLRPPRLQHVRVQQRRLHPVRHLVEQGARDGFPHLDEATTLLAGVTLPI